MVSALAWSGRDVFPVLFHHHLPPKRRDVLHLAPVDIWLIRFYFPSVAERKSLKQRTQKRPFPSLSCLLCPSVTVHQTVFSTFLLCFLALVPLLCSKLLAICSILDGIGVVRKVRSVDLHGVPLPESHISNVVRTLIMCKTMFLEASKCFNQTIQFMWLFQIVWMQTQRNNSTAYPYSYSVPTSWQDQVL